MDYHIRQMGNRPNAGEITNRKLRVIMHFTVPPGNNSAGKSWVSCIVADDYIQKDTVLSDTEIAPAEKTAIQNGQVLEYVENIEVWEDATPLQLKAKVEAAYNTKKNFISKELSRRYGFWGYSGDV